SGTALDPLTFTARSAVGSLKWSIDHIYASAFTGNNALTPYDGAIGNATDGFSYFGTGGAYDTSTRTGTATYVGRVCGGYVAGGFTGTCPKTPVGPPPAHQIQLSIANPTITLAGDEGTLTADVF